MDEQVVIEGCDVEEDRLVVKKEFGEEGKVLAKELSRGVRQSFSFVPGSPPTTHLMLLAVDLVDSVVIFRVDQLTRRWFGSLTA